ncbi:hypothetical protein TRICI_000407 [Trichomonascus ciferrii]|uniref:Triacylglycerol lipase n=1 Tax=Trichomonascus ciferrii TaxID=44093 RepID=A0A642VDJ8_9ASCO|nr:hypothetical protein TRICI_000407 [Trichomonascus ciferrii]
MRMQMRFLGSILGFLGIGGVVKDDLYEPPLGFELAEPGTILQSREVGQLPGLTNVQGVYQLLYRTADTFSNPEAAVTTVIVPKNTTNKVISYQIPEDAVADQCAPSRSLRVNVTDPAIQRILDFGHIVSTPDYEGLQNAFTAGIQAGQATLDSIRAVLASQDITGIPSNAKLGIWGYSGGSIASGWAAELHPTYAPELSVAGVAVGGYAVDPSAIIRLFNGTINAGLLPASLVGLSNEYPKVRELLDTQLKPELVDDFYYVSTHCVDEVTQHYAYQDVFKFFKDGGDILENEVLKKISNDITLGQHIPKVPLYIYQGIKDELVSCKSVDEIVKHYCRAGVSVEYCQNTHGDHMETEYDGIEFALHWLDTRLNSNHTPTGCSFKKANFSLGYIQNSDTSTAQESESKISLSISTLFTTLLSFFL